jgi:sugar (pentulose or hexulose) kinase
MALLGIDIGTTHCKAGVFEADGTALSIASRPTITRRTADDRPYFDPRELWQTVRTIIREAVKGQSSPINAIGIASMAESGVVVDRMGGDPRGMMLAWFDTSSQPQAERIRHYIDPLPLYLKTGLRATYKCGLAKVMWLHDQNPAIFTDAEWLSAADFIANRLTEAFSTDYSLAGRTCAFDIIGNDWDSNILDAVGLPAQLFPQAAPSGTPIGQTEAWLDLDSIGLPAGIPVAVSGHDHVCGAFAVGATKPGVVFDSMGTAEVLIGAMPERALSEADYDNGLLVGCHVAHGMFYWMGGLSASGGAVEWLRTQLGDPPLSYSDIEALVKTAKPEPTGILFFPYLLGSGSPHTDPSVRGAILGISQHHSRADIARAVLEGTAYEIEVIRRAGEAMSGQPIKTLIAAGGGTKNREWLQIKADVSGCCIEVFPQPEATLLGAALAAGIGCGVISEVPAQRPTQTIEPDAARHDRYRALFEDAYLPMQAPLRQLGKLGSSTG